MLGRLRMSVEEALGKYRSISNDIFHKDFRQSFWWVPGRTKYSAREIERAVETIVRERMPERFHMSGKTVFSQMPSPSDLCKVFVVPGIPLSSLLICP